MRRAALILLLLAIARPASAQQAVTVGPVTAQPGHRRGRNDPGRRPHRRQRDDNPDHRHQRRVGRPVLALIAGTHGMEYVPIVALQRMRDKIDPKTLKGTIVMVHVANMPSFLGRTIYYSPIDGKNLESGLPRQGRRDDLRPHRVHHHARRDRARDARRRSALRRRQRVAPALQLLDHDRRSQSGAGGTRDGARLRPRPHRRGQRAPDRSRRVRVHVEHRHHAREARP